MKFLLDNHLPAQLAVSLRWRGHDCSLVSDFGLDEAGDLEVWTWATNEEYVVVSKDEDFVPLASRPGDRGRFVWVRLGNCRNQALIQAFDRVLDDLVAALDSGQRIVEVR